MNPWRKRRRRKLYRAKLALTNSISASHLVNIIPGALSAGGNPLSLNGVYLTNDLSIAMTYYENEFDFEMNRIVVGENARLAALGFSEPETDASVRERLRLLGCEEAATAIGYRLDVLLAKYHLVRGGIQL